MVISLPASWIRKFNLKKGTEIELIEKDRQITINVPGIKEKKEPTKATLDITNMPPELISRYIIAAYKKGTEETKIIHRNKKIFDPRTKKEIRLNDFIEIVVDSLIGVEIIRQETNFTLVKQVSAISETELDTILDRIFLLLTSSSKEIIDFVKSSDKELQQEILLKHHKIEKFVNYCLRIINKKGHPTKYVKTALFYYLIFELAELSEEYTSIAKIVMDKRIKCSENILKLFIQTNDLWALFYKLFYKYKEGLLIELINKKTQICEEMDKFYKRVSPDEYILLEKLSIITVKILNLMETKISIIIE